MSMLSIRQSGNADLAAIGDIHLSAFGPEEGPEIVALVNAILIDKMARPLLSLVAETDGEPVGHVLFTKVSLQPQAQTVSAQILAPLAVSRAWQGRGVGTELVREGLKRLSGSGIDLVFVLGHPEYYPRFGFGPAGALGFGAPYPIQPQHAEAWMVLALKPGVIGRVKGTVHCAEALDKPQYWQA